MEEQIYLSPEAKRLISLLREDNSENIGAMFNTLLDQLCTLTVCSAGGGIDKKMCGEIMLTIANYKDLLSSLLEDKPKNE